MILIFVEQIRDDFNLYYGKYYKQAIKHVDELAEDIAKNGLKVPIEIHKIKPDFYEVVEGVHRLRAVKKLGWKKIPCEILNHGPDAKPYPRERYS